MTEPSRPSWGDIVKAAEDSPRPVTDPHPDPTVVAAVEIPAPIPARPAVPETQPSPAAASTYGIPDSAVANTATVPPAGQYTYGGTPAGYSSLPTPGPSLAVKATQAVVAAAVLAAVGFGGYWGYDTILKKKDTHTEAAAESDSKPADSGDQPKGSAPEADSAPNSAPSSAPPAGVYPPDEGMYLMLLRNKTGMTITNPDRLLDLGKEVCVYLGTQTGSPSEVVVNVRGMLLQEGVTSNDGLHITSSAITALCPQHKSKILPG